MIYPRTSHDAQSDVGSNNKADKRNPVGPVPPPGADAILHPEDLRRRLRRLHRVWPDRNGQISYLLTICVEGRSAVLDNEPTFERLVTFLCDSPKRYHWFGRRFVIMPDHIHLIAHTGLDAIRLGQWMKALKAVVAGLETREARPVRAPGLQGGTSSEAAGRVPPPGVSMATTGAPSSNHPEHAFTRANRAWRWQAGFHDYKIRTPESESRKWEYVCLNPVRYGLVKRPEEWRFGGEIFYDRAGGPRLIRGTPPLLDRAMLIQKGETPREGTRPTK